MRTDTPDLILVVKQSDGTYTPLVTGFGIKMLPSDVTKLIDDLTTYQQTHSDTEIELQNEITRNHLYD